MKIKRGLGKRVSNFGVKDYYSFYNSNNKYKISRKDFSYIISEMNQFIHDEIVENAIDMTLPCSIGELGIRKAKVIPKIVEGKVINNSPPDWNKTLKLWEKDKEARDLKIIIKHSNSHTGGYIYKIYYKKSKATYKNKSAYKFKPCRDFQRNITKRINDYTKNKYDGILLYKNK